MYVETRYDNVCQSKITTSDMVAIIPPLQETDKILIAENSSPCKDTCAKIPIMVLGLLLDAYLIFIFIHSLLGYIFYYIIQGA